MSVYRIYNKYITTGSVANGQREQWSTTSRPVIGNTRCVLAQPYEINQAARRRMWYSTSNCVENLKLGFGYATISFADCSVSYNYDNDIEIKLAREPLKLAIGIPLLQSLADFDRTISSLTSVPGNVGDKVNEKTANILSKNPGYYQLKEIQDILEGKTLQKPTKFSIEQLTAFVQAPLNSCDAERSFSRYKAMLRDNRRRMTTENIRHCLVVNCNSINGAFSNESSTSKSLDQT
ncbi:hypothetical protein ANN_05223 [Periplaneta americana]|uniref:HAT C-terminal dimerisation domain-containing protein n=1 Tax=Periplaneta americana TaxID=6978 RepID=A0ABQ8TD10_PERAM|nr:hypothetical protein ANN_05223 [Periplaneta americana]